MAEIRQKSGRSVVQNMYIDHGDDARLPNVPVQFTGTVFQHSECIALNDQKITKELAFRPRHTHGHARRAHIA